MSRRETRVPLSVLTPGATGIVACVHCSGRLRRRLLDMGVVPGVEVRVDRFAPLGDPMVISLMGYRLSLRRQEAAAVLVDVVGFSGLSGPCPLVPGGAPHCARKLGFPNILPALARWHNPWARTGKRRRRKRR